MSRSARCGHVVEGEEPSAQLGGQLGRSSFSISARPRPAAAGGALAQDRRAPPPCRSPCACLHATSALSSVVRASPTSRRTSGATDSMVAMRLSTSGRSFSESRSMTPAAREESSEERTRAMVCGCSRWRTMASASGSAWETGPRASSGGGGGRTPSKARRAASGPERALGHLAEEVVAGRRVAGGRLHVAHELLEGFVHDQGSTGAQLLGAERDAPQLHLAQNLEDRGGHVGADAQQDGGGALAPQAVGLRQRGDGSGGRQGARHGRGGVRHWGSSGFGSLAARRPSRPSGWRRRGRGPWWRAPWPVRAG